MQNKDNRFPLLQAQLGVLLDTIKYPNSSQGLVNFIIEMMPDIDVERLAQAIEYTANRLDDLFIRFGIDGSEFYQYVDRSTPIVVKRCEMHEEEVDAYIRSQVKPLDILGGPLFSIQIIKTTGGVYVIFNTTHALFDGYSSLALAKEFMKRYQGEGDEKEFVPISRSVESELKELESEAYYKAKAYSQMNFVDAPTIHILQKHPHAMGVLKRLLVKVERKPFDVFASETGIKANRIFMAAFAMALHACSGEKKVAFDALYHGRDDEYKRQSLGMFVRNVPVMADFGDKQASLRTLNEDFDKNFAGNRHGVYPYLHFCNDLGVVINNTYSFVSGRSFVKCSDRRFPIHEYHGGDYADENALLIFENETYYDVCLEFNTARCDEKDALQLQQMIVTVAKNVIEAGADAPLCNIDLITTEEREKLLNLGLGEKMEQDERLLFELIDQRAQETPDAEAVVDCESSITYKELKVYSDQFAMWLHSIGITKGDAIALKMPRRKEFVVATIGAMKAGVTYVPVDMNYPEDRISYMLENSESKKMVTQQEFLSVMSTPLTPHALQNDVGAHDAAYIIYTSGSTGKPKGVCISHKALTSFIRTCVKTYDLTSSDRIMCQGTFCFDASIEDLYPILSVGGVLHVLEEDKTKDLDAIALYIKENDITGCNFTTQLGQMLLAIYPDLDLRYMTVGGEKLNTLPEHHRCRFFNSYGPTEFTVDATFWEAEGKHQSIPIGRPVCNAQVYILDRQRRLLPEGFDGELFLAGDQIANGYFNLQKETESRFVHNPFSDDYPLMYATGDIVRWGADGNIYFVGRRDGQVKLRGFRIELDEVNECLLRDERILDAYTAVRNINGHESLCSWYLTHDTIDEQIMKGRLNNSLPAYMVPDVFVAMESFPCMPNGKVNVSALPEPVISNLRKDKVKPETVKEIVLYRIASRVLGNTDFGVTDGLHDEGMTSMMSMQFCAEAKKDGVFVKVSDVMSNKSIRELAEDMSSMVTWYKPYVKGKPVVVMVSGIVPTHYNAPKLDYISKELNVLFVEPLEDHFRAVWEEEDPFDSIVQLYYALLDAYLPADETISAFMGFSVGGFIAYALAEEYYKDKGTMSKVILGDTRAEYEQAPEYTEEQRLELRAMLTERLIPFLAGKRQDYQNEEAYMELVSHEAEIYVLRTIYADKVCGGQQVTPLPCDALLINTIAEKPRNVLPDSWRPLVRSLDVLDVMKTHEELCGNNDDETLVLLCERILYFLKK